MNSNPSSGKTREFPDEVTKMNPLSGKTHEIPDDNIK